MPIHVHLSLRLDRMGNFLPHPRSLLTVACPRTDMVPASSHLPKCVPWDKNVSNIFLAPRVSSIGRSLVQKFTDV